MEPGSFMESRTMRIEHWINNELIAIDTEDVWAETFAHWDCLVATDTASENRIFPSTLMRPENTFSM